jgi:hypothetical protein
MIPIILVGASYCGDFFSTNLVSDTQTYVKTDFRCKEKIIELEFDSWTNNIDQSMFNGAICSNSDPMSPITVVQDTSISEDWALNKPCACIILDDPNSQAKMTFKIKGGPKHVSRLRYLGRGPDKEDGRNVVFEIGGRVVGQSDPDAPANEWQEIELLVPEIPFGETITLTKPSSTTFTFCSL